LYTKFLQHPARPTLFFRANPHGCTQVTVLQPAGACPRLSPIVSCGGTRDGSIWRPVTRSSCESLRQTAGITTSTGTHDVPRSRIFGIHCSMRSWITARSAGATCSRRTRYARRSFSAREWRNVPSRTRCASFGLTTSVWHGRRWTSCYVRSRGVAQSLHAPSVYCCNIVTSSKSSRTPLMSRPRRE